MDKIMARSICFSVISHIEKLHESSIAQSPEDILEGLDLARRALVAVYRKSELSEEKMGVSVVETAPAVSEPERTAPAVSQAPVAELSKPMKVYDPVLKAHKAKLAKALKSNFAWDFDNKEHQEMATEISDMLKEMLVTIENDEIFLAEVQSCVAKVQSKKSPAGAPF